MPLMPDLILQEIPINVRPNGVIEFGEQHSAAMLGEFSIQIRADSIDDWHISSVMLGKQELKGRILEIACQHFEAEFTQDCHDHVRDNLPDEVDDIDDARLVFVSSAGERH